MQVISRNRNSEVVYLIKNHYGAIYSRLAQLLEEDLAYFAKPQPKSNEMIWLYPGQGKAVSYAALDTADKDWVSEQLSEIRSHVQSRLQADPELAHISPVLFQLPEEQDLYLLDPKGKRQILLTKWACTPADNPTGIDPLSRVIAREKRAYETVLVQAQYTDGLPVEQSPVKVFYKGRELTHTTTEAGLINLGLVKAGHQIRIVKDWDTDNPIERGFVVIKGKKEYQVVFPYFMDITVEVQDQDHLPMPGIDLEGFHDGVSVVYQTDEDSTFVVSRFELGRTPLEIGLPGDASSRQSFPIDRNTTHLSYTLFQQRFAEVKIKVIDESDQAITGYPLTVRYSHDSQIEFSDQHGMISLPSMEEEERLHIIDHRNPQNSISHTVERGTNQLTIRVSVYAKVFLHKGNNRPVAKANLSFRAQSFEKNLQTNQDGYCKLDNRQLEDQEKVQVNIQLSDRQNSRTYKKQFTYSESQQEYVLTLRSWRWLWWLLLLLLPLLLLIQWERTIYISAVNQETGLRVPQTDIRFAHQESHLYHQGAFLPTYNKQQEVQTDSNGIAQIAPIGYSLYSWIFDRQFEVATWVIGKCFESDTLTWANHSLSDGDTLLLPIRPVFTSLDFLVVDASDDEPLPDAFVSIEARFEGAVYTDSAQSGSDGRVVFQRLPFCGDIGEVKASLYGYLPDSIESISLAQISDSLHTDRKLRLKPITEKLIFFVTDCETGRPLGGAKVTVELDYKGKKTRQTRKTNIRGVGKGEIGKGEYNDAKKVSKVRLEASYPYYEDGVFPPTRVDSFLNLTKVERTICLKPIPNPAMFQNIDCLSNQPLAGVKNQITIENAGKKETKEVESDANGNFGLSVKPGDKLTIISEYPPDYERNDTSIVQEDGIRLSTGPKSNRIIPLCPKEVELKFRTVKEENPSVVIPGATAIINIPYLGSQSLTSDQSGEFTVRAPITGRISIEASKPGYSSNNTKVNNRAVKELFHSNQSERDIPLAQPPPLCNVSESGKGQGDFVQSYSVGTGSFTILINYHMYGAPDHMIVYCGRSPNAGNILAQTNGRVKNKLGSPLRIDLNRCSGQAITVEIKARSGGSNWDFTIECLNN